MHTRIVLLAVLTSFVASCKGVDCGDGTTERNGVCVASNETVGDAKCGPFTVLQGTQCTPMLPPTVCDPASTEEDVDENGVITCIGTGGGGCSARLACPIPTVSGTQTICGQIYDFATGQPFAAPGATGTRCTTATPNGPCSVGIRAFEATTFVTSQGAQGVLQTGEVYIDDCGRYRVTGIVLPGTPLIALGVDDALMANAGPPGTTNSVGVGTGAEAGRATRDLELFVVPGATLAGWMPNMTNGPSFGATQGIYAAMFRGHSSGTDTASGVTITRNGAPVDTRDYYFTETPNRATLNTTGSATSSNGGALFTIDPVSQMLSDVYSGTGGLPAGCIWEQRPGASVGFVILVQIFRPIAAPGMTCSL